MQISVKNNSAIAHDDNSVRQNEIQRAGQRQLFHIATGARHIARALAVIDRNDALGNDRSLV